LQRVWFPYFPNPASSPQLQAVLVDQQGRRWAQESRSTDLRVDPYPPGSVLHNLHPSPDHRWIIADLAFSGSYLIDLSSGASRPVISDVYTGPGQFLAWSPDSQRVIILPETFPQEVWLMDIFSQEHRTLELPISDFGYSLVRAVAYSPDGKQFADAVVYPATISRPDEEIEIGVRVGEHGTRMSVLRVSGGGMIAEHSLRWSSDGRTLIFVADVHDGGRRTQLWAINVSDGSSRLLATLAQEVQYNHPAVWSPDGRYIAAIVEEADDNGIVSDNIYLFPLESGDAQKITQFANRRLSHLAWSPDGSMLAFSVSLGDYGEIWVTTLDGTRLHPIAGPTIPDAPFAWLP
jgi:WD40 repeat protein